MDLDAELVHLVFHFGPDDRRLHCCRGEAPPRRAVAVPIRILPAA
jgi:hypothetical protein